LEEDFWPTDLLETVVVEEVRTMTMDKGAEGKTILEAAGVGGHQLE
jgi:hypothetical protein